MYNKRYMIIPAILAVVAAIFYAATNHIDKYLISKLVKNADYRALILVSTIIAGGIMSLIYLFVCGFSLNFQLGGVLILLLNSILYTIANIFWFKALNRDDASEVVIMFQLIPVFMLFLSPLLGLEQNISALQLIGGGIVTAAAIFVTYEPSERKFDRGKLITLAIMAVVSVLYALWFILERKVNESMGFNQTTFWSNVTLLVVGCAIWAIFKGYRKAFSKLLKTNGKKVIALNLVNEMLNSFGGVFSTFAGTLTSVALVSFVSQGVQPFAVLLMGILITKFMPKVEKEDISRKVVATRVVMIALCVIGLACIEFG